MYFIGNVLENTQALINAGVPANSIRNCLRNDGMIISHPLWSPKNECKITLFNKHANRKGIEALVLGKVPETKRCFTCPSDLILNFLYCKKCCAAVCYDCQQKQYKSNITVSETRNPQFYQEIRCPSCKILLKRSKKPNFTDPLTGKFDFTRSKIIDPFAKLVVDKVSKAYEENPDIDVDKLVKTTLDAYK